ncbi:hypothetical protein [Tenacibaculum sp. A30]|uniref:hypothetical protein n=1 Tax=Tenacibaculum sp. A30 TaxID=3442644 RepID=UPI003EBD9A86
MKKKIILIILITICSYSYSQNNNSNHNNDSDLKEKATNYINKAIENQNDKLKMTIQKSRFVIVKDINEGNCDLAIEKSLFTLKIAPKETYFMILAGEAYKCKRDYKNAILWFKKANEIFKTDDLRNEIKLLEKKIK